ncbi:NAD(P)-dependent dehydrogenase (short-subunit alcohol dehydrogenase family) [Salirhabdus euzebyi]|uniref:L-rhamnose 1-dehydrogenase (NAD(P)(+)) n=1 Tax=Salirhabdus euzebyi TaxID=394506 RepID=A0A841PWL1_9BACI|nr:glucose 1-dehydrogenase [Salirhabdus euzebyi]MBB6452264.1 NAD(P)-dependent dehydrogenase (short-subunit alcohol dehydrogenase family) [Salirhabdus euzebyi]
METYLPSFHLEGKTAVITGATKGIGRAISISYAEAGANVILISRTKSDLDQLKTDLEMRGTNVQTIIGDVQQYKEIIKRVDDVIGDRSIDVWVNNAGMNIRSEAEKVTEEEWDQIINTNMKSAFFFSQYAAKKMKEQEYGKIINISSVAGHVALRTGVVYAMTKAALIQMTKTLSLEWGKYGIRVNAIGPWYFPTSLTEKLLQNEQYVQDIVDRTPLKRIGELKELAGTAVFLATEASDYITGQTIFVDGGMTIYGF